MNLVRPSNGRLNHAPQAQTTSAAGDCAVLPRGVPHGFRNVGSAAGRFLCFVTPGGLEEFFIAVGTSPALPTPTQLVAMAKPYGLTMLPPGA